MEAPYDKKIVDLIQRMNEGYKPRAGELRALRSLDELNLSGASISSLEPLRSLTNLKSLDLSGTNVSSLEPVASLTNLQTLDLRNTKIRSLEELSPLERLDKLYIGGTTLDHIPQFLIDKGVHFVTDRDWGIEPGVYMRNVELLEQPFSLFSKSSSLIKAYYQEKQVTVNEAKVIFLGDGGVGKTYTIYRIEHDGKAPDGTETTPGVSITQYLLAGNVSVNFWDFGGQEIMHSMHRCFLTERTLYVAMATNRWSEVTRQARRWLKEIESSAPNSKIILALNCWEGVDIQDLDDNRLKKEFPRLVDVVKYTAIKDVSSLKQKIEEQVDSMSSAKMNLPQSWSNIMSRLRDMRDEEGEKIHYIRKSRYDEICKENGITDPELSSWLLDWFKDIGICFYFPKEDDAKRKLSENYMILNPEWLTNAIYIIINNGKQHALNGRIKHASLCQLLKSPKIYVTREIRYSKDELDYILQIMRKFRLSFELGRDQEFVPALCHNVTPEALLPKNEEIIRHIRCKVRYDYLPDSVVHRLMVDCIGSFNLDYSKCWLKGLCVDERAACGIIAVCDMGKDDDALSVDVCQVEETLVKPQTLLRKLLDMIAKINDELNLKSTLWICSDDGKASFQETSLRRALERGISEIPYMGDGRFELYDVRKLLGQYDDDTSYLDENQNAQSLRDDVDFLQKNPFLKSAVARLLGTSSTVAFNNSNNFNGYGRSRIVNGNRGVARNCQNMIARGDASEDVLSDERQTAFSRQLEQFRTELNERDELNKGQKELFYDAVGELIDNLNDPDERLKWEKRIRNISNSFGGEAEKAINLVAKNTGVLKFLEL